MTRSIHWLLGVRKKSKVAFELTGRISGEKKKVAKVGNNVEIGSAECHFIQGTFLSLLIFPAHYISPHLSSLIIHPSTPFPIPTHFPKHAHLSLLLSNTNHTASRTATRIARSLTLLVPALAQIVRASMHDDRPAEHALGANELDLLVRDGTLGVALAVRLEVTEVADVAFAVGWGAVRFGEGVDW